jgi:hypothetical protein
VDTSEDVSQKILCTLFIFHTPYKTLQYMSRQLAKSLFVLLSKQEDIQYNILHLAFNSQLYKDILISRDMSKQCKLKVKQSCYRPGVAQRVPGS